MNKPNKELREQLAAIEHERWADWQRYCNQVLRARATDERTLEERLQHWDRQINTPYELLSEKEKNSDREQVDRYWSIIENYLNSEINRVIDEVLEIVGHISFTKGDTYDKTLVVSALAKDRDELRTLIQAKRRV